MSGKGIIRVLFFILLFTLLMGCGRKAPPTLPEKPSSLSLNLETGEQDLSKEGVALHLWFF